MPSDIARFGVGDVLHRENRQKSRTVSAPNVQRDERLHVAGMDRRFAAESVLPGCGPVSRFPQTRPTVLNVDVGRLILFVAPVHLQRQAGLAKTRSAAKQ